MRVIFDEKTNFLFTFGKNNATFCLDLDPHTDPNLHSSKRLNPNPHIINADPKH
jgi:hypothetical protein